MATDSALPAIDDETKEMLENQVKKGKARKFVLIYKGADIRSLVIFKKGPYGTKITAAKKAGFKGEVVCGIATGKGVSITFQIPGTSEVQEAMKGEGNVCTEDPCKIAKLREFLKDEGDLKFKPEFQIITRVDALAVVSEEDEQEDDLEIGLTKQRLIEALKKVKPHILKAIEANPARKDEVLAAAAKVKQLIQEGKFEEAQTAMLELGGLLREILKAAAKQPQTTATTGSSTSAPTTAPTNGAPPTSEKTDSSPTKKSEWDKLIMQLSPMLRAFVQFKLGDYAKLGALFKQAQAAKPDNIDQAVELLKQCAAQVKSMEEKYRRAYEKVRDENAARFDNAAKHEPIKDYIVAGRADAATMATEFNYGAAVGKLRELIDLIHGESSKIEQEFTKIYDDVIFREIEFERDPNVARDAVKKYLQNWDLVAAAAEVKKFKTEVDRAKRVGFSDLGEIESRSEQAKLQNAQHSRNTAMAVNAAKKLIDDDGNLRIDADLLSDLPHVPAHHLAGVAEEIANSGFSDLPQTVHSLEVLKRLQADENVRNALNNVGAPPAQDGTAAKMIRATLGLKKDAPVTDADARRAALSALMFQARQGQVGSCFTTASAVQVQRNRPEQFLADMQELFSTGKLTRTIQHGGGDYAIEVPLNTEMLVSNLEKKTTVPRSGGNLHLAPDVAASLDFLNVKPDDREQVIKDGAQDVRAKAAIEAAMNELKDWLNPEGKIKDVAGEAMKVLRANRSLSIKDALNQSLNNLGMSAKPADVDWCAGELGHADADDYATSQGYTDYADFQTKTGKNIQDEYAKSEGFTYAEAWNRDFGLKKCTSFDNMGASDSVSPQQILAEVVENRVPEDQRAATTKGANDAFLGQQDNRLMRAWEYTIATMVERNPGKQSNGDRMNAGINGASKDKLQQFAENYITDNGITDPGVKNSVRAIAREVSTQFFNKLAKASKAQYDPSAKTVKQSVAADGHSSSGGYGLSHGDKRIDSEAAFSKMLEDLMKETLTVTDTTAGWNGAAKDLGREFGADMIKHMQTKDFRDQCIAKNPTADKDKLAHPWTHTGGGDEAPLMQFYNNHDAPLATSSSKDYEYEVEIDDGSGTKTKVKKRGDTAEGVTHFLLETLKKMKVGDRLASEGSESAGVRVRTLPVHSFTLTPGNPAMFSILNGDKDSATVIEEMKKSEKKKNEQRRTTAMPLKDPPDGAVLKLLEKATSHWSSKTVEGVRNKVKQRLKALGKDTITVAELQTEINGVIDVDYASQGAEWQTKVKATNDKLLGGGLVDMIVPREEFELLIEAALTKLKVSDDKREAVKKSALAALKSDAVDKAEIEKAVRAALLEANVDIDQKRIATALNEPRGLVFADTNWGDGQHMTHFSMVVNPLTDELEMWEMNEDGSNPRPADQAKWIKNATRWEVFSDASEYGGTTGENAWEVRRGDLREKLKECVSKRQGSISMMQAVLEIADQKFSEGDRAGGEKALDRLDSLLKRADKLAANVTEAGSELEKFKAAVQKVAIDEAKDAAAFVDTLIREVRVLRDDNSIADFETRRKSDLDLLKQGKQHLGVDVDILAILAKA